NPVQTTYDGNPLAVNFQVDEFTAIHGTVYSDLPAGRVGLSGWTVYLDANGNGELDAGEVSTLSATDGLYAFHNVPLDSTQTVRVQLREGYFQTAPAAPGTYTVDVGDERFRIYDNNDFSVLPFSTISGTVTGHPLQNGVLDPNTVPQEGFAVHLLQGDT